MEYIGIKLNKFINIKELIMIHYFEYTQYFEFEGEKHDFWEFVYVDNDRIAVYSDGVEHIVEMGEVIFHKPNEFHGLKAFKGTNPNLIIISFKCTDKVMEHFNGLHIKVGSTEKVLLHKILHETKLTFKNVIHQPVEIVGMVRRENAMPGGEHLIISYLEQFLIEIYRYRVTEQNSSYDHANLSFMLPQSENQYIAETLVLLNNKITSKLKVEEISHAIGIGRSRLQQLFYEEFGCGVLDYFNTLKAVAAKNMLRSTNVNINDISDKLAFSSSAYFSRCFKRTFGITPSQYRKSVYDATEGASDISRLKKYDDLMY